jgi:hypothetical protein
LACTPHAPTVNVSPSVQTGLPGARLNYAVSLVNDDASTCGSTTFALAFSVPATWFATLSASSVSLGASASGTLTLEVTSPPGSVAGSNAVSINVSDGLSSVHTASSAATYIVGDAIPPTAPSGLTASLKRREVSLAWRAAADNVAVAGYQVWRNGALLATTTATNWLDATVAQGSVYTYYVVAYDAAGNVSPRSNTVTTGTITVTGKRK